MTFQFQCPQGHLLEAEQSQAGQQSQCPVCGETFFIPASTDAPAASPAPQVGPFGPPPELAPQPDTFAISPTAGGPAIAPSAEFSQPKLLHIPCPNGHELEVPNEMIGQDVMCPHCQAQFHLRLKDSVEHKLRRQEELERKDYKAGQTWFMWAIIFAILVLIGLVAMIAVSAGV